MIPVRELMIGNWVMITDGNVNAPFQIEPHDFDQIVLGDSCSREYKPILITEKLCDQIVAMNSDIKIGYHDDNFVKNQFSVKIGNVERLFKVSTLHEVQNLYYAIMKKELIVQP